MYHFKSESKLLCLKNTFKLSCYKSQKEIEIQWGLILLDIAFRLFFTFFSKNSILELLDRNYLSINIHLHGFWLSVWFFVAVTKHKKLLFKVQLFWKGHLYGFDIYFVNAKTIRRMAQIFVAFSEKLNFK